KPRSTNAVVYTKQVPARPRVAASSKGPRLSRFNVTVATVYLGAIGSRLCVQLWASRTLVTQSAAVQGFPDRLKAKHLASGSRNILGTSGSVPRMALFDPKQSVGCKEADVQYEILRVPLTILRNATPWVRASVR